MTVSASTGTLRATPPDEEPIRKARAAGTLNKSTVSFRFAFATASLKISEIPEERATFLRNKAPKDARGTFHRDQSFRIFPKMFALVFMIIERISIPTSVAIAIFTFSVAVKRTVTIIGEKENKKPLRSAFSV